MLNQKIISIESNNIFTADDEDFLGKYVNSLRSCPAYEHEEVIAKFQQMDRTKSFEEIIAIRDDIVKAHLRFVVFYVKKNYAFSKEITSQLISAGNVGLLKAVDKFDPSMGYHFTSYCSWWLMSEIEKVINKILYNPHVYIPHNILQDIMKIKKNIDVYTALNNDYSPKDIADSTGLSREVVDLYFARSNFVNDYVSLDAFFSANSEYADEHGPMNIADEKFIPDKIYFAEELPVSIEKALAKAGLSDQQKYILIAYYGLGAKERLKLQEIGDKYNCTNENIRQTRNKTLRRLRNDPNIVSLLKDYL